MLWQELANLQLERDQAREAAMEEHEIDGEVLVAHLDWVLRADEAEVSAQFADEAAQVA